MVEGFWKTRDNGGKAAWLFIGILSSIYWVSDVISSSRARGTPLARGEGSELGIWPGPKSSPKNAYRGTAAK